MLVTFVFIGIAIVVVAVVGLVVVGRETSRLAHQARPAVFDLEEAVAFISDRLPDDVASRLTPDDVRWVLRTDAESLELATDHPEDVELGPEYLDEDAALARVLAAADEDDLALADGDLASILAERTNYLEAIGAVGPAATDPRDGG